jgi:hypothetical protein
MLLLFVICKPFACALHQTAKKLPTIFCKNSTIYHTFFVFRYKNENRFYYQIFNHRGKKLKTHKQQKTITNRASVQQQFKTQFLPQKAKSAFKPYVLVAGFLFKKFQILYF